MKTAIEYTARSGEVIQTTASITRKKWNRNTIPALRDTAKDVKMWNAAQKDGTEGVMALFQSMKNGYDPLKKVKTRAKAKTATRKPAKSIPESIGEALISHTISISFPTFPGWEVVKKLRELPLKWNAKARAYQADYSTKLIQQLNGVLA